MALYMNLGCSYICVMLTMLMVDTAGNPFNAEVYLPFESVTGDYVPGGTFHGTLVNGTSAYVQPGIQGNGLAVSQTKVSIGNWRDGCFWLPELCLEGMTFAVWIKLGTSDRSTQYFISNGGQTTFSYGIALSMKTTGLLVTVRTTINSFIMLDDPETTYESKVGQFFQVVVTWQKSTNETKMYVDGNLKASSTALQKLTPLSEPSDYNEYIFGASNQPLHPKYSEGILDEFLFWPEIKDAAFIKSVYHSYLTDIQTILSRTIYPPMDLFALIDQSTDTCLKLRNLDPITSSRHPADQLGPMLQFELPDSMLDDIPEQFTITLTFLGTLECNYYIRLGISEPVDPHRDSGVSMKMCYFLNLNRVSNFSVNTYSCNGVPKAVYLSYPTSELCEIEFNTL